MTVPNDVLIWLDVETTGFDPEGDHLLEIAAVATGMDSNLTAFGEAFSMRIHPPAELRMLSVSIDVLEMHATSGLWRDVRDSAYTEEHAWRAFMSWAARLSLGSAETRSLAGRSVHFDRAWLEASMPASDLKILRLSHRHFDLTAIKAFAAITGMRMDVPEDAHRALDDVWADIALARMLISEGSVLE